MAVINPRLLLTYSTFVLSFATLILPAGCDKTRLDKPLSTGDTATYSLSLAMKIDADSVFFSEKQISVYFKDTLGNPGWFFHAANNSLEFWFRVCCNYSYIYGEYSIDGGPLQYLWFSGSNRLHWGEVHFLSMDENAGAFSSTSGNLNLSVASLSYSFMSGNFSGQITDSAGVIHSISSGSFISPSVKNLDYIQH